MFALLVIFHIWMYKNLSYYCCCCFASYFSYLDL
uniref:Uncharacterized protein n=1 Tax=Arundo donax TaxID=35708 RepID=A0A0A9F8Q2_ARUDO